MKVAELLRNTKQTLFSLELLPPLKGNNVETLYEAIDPLMEFNPSYINVTYHREEIVYKKHPNGLLEPKAVKKRPGTVGVSAAIMHRYNTPVVPHLICAGFNREETENALIELQFLGINNLLVLRGDADKSTRRFEATPGGHAHAVDLLNQIMDLNKGKYVDNENTNHPESINFSAGVAGYPEKHGEAPNMENDMKYLKMKVDAGAEYVVTQMFFDNKKYFDFVDNCRKNGINVPIVPGIKPISIVDHLTILPQTFHIDLPSELVHEIENCKDNKQVRQVGIEWAIKQCKELKASGVPVIHFYTMGKSDNILQIAKNVY